MELDRELDRKLDESVYEACMSHTRRLISTRCEARYKAFFKHVYSLTECL